MQINCLKNLQNINNAYKNSIILTKILSNTVKYLKNIDKILNTENKNVKILTK